MLKKNAIEGFDSNCLLSVILEDIEWLFLNFTADQPSSIHEKGEKN